MRHTRTLLALIGFAGVIALGAGCDGGDPTAAAKPQKSDESAPTTPTDVSVSALGARRLALRWGRSEDDNAVARYVVRRNGIDLDVVPAGTVRYTVRRLSPATEYRFSVAAVDGAGNRSKESSPIAVKTKILVTRQRLVFRPVADAYVTQVRPFNAYGTISRKLRMDGKPIRRSYLRFEVSGLRGSITRVTLKLYANKGSGRGYFVHRVDPVAWAEGSVTFASAPGFANRSIASSGPFPPETWTQVRIRNLVAGDGLVTLALTTDDVTLISLASREAGNRAPRLVVETVRPLSD
jgi:hypothetical protein